jgi:hypothetical protein
MNIRFCYDFLFAIASAVSSSPVPPPRALTPLTILTIVLPRDERLGEHQCAVVRDAWPIVSRYSPAGDIPARLSPRRH